MATRALAAIGDVMADTQATLAQIRGIAPGDVLAMGARNRPDAILTGFNEALAADPSGGYVAKQRLSI